MKPSKAGWIGVLVVSVLWILLATIPTIIWNNAPHESRSFLPASVLAFLPGFWLLEGAGITGSSLAEIIILGAVSLLIYTGITFLICWGMAKLKQKYPD